MRKLLILAALLAGLLLAGCQSGSGGGGGGYITQAHPGYGPQSPIVLQFDA